MPIPNPNIIKPTKYRGESGRKKNPTPIPMITPPPIAQVLLSSFLSDIGKNHGLTLFKTSANAKKHFPKFLIILDDVTISFF